jgi:hypothetical protein
MFTQALALSLKLNDLQDVLLKPEREASFQIQAISALMTGSRAECSYAFTKLEVMGANREYASLALKVFAKPWLIERSSDASRFSIPPLPGSGANDHIRLIHESAFPYNSLSLSKVDLISCDKCRNFTSELNSKRKHCAVCHQTL